MDTSPIRSLQPHQDKLRIRVRICRTWRPKVFGSDHQFAGLECILVDAMGDAIQATVKEIDYDCVAPKIQSGAAYDISCFHTIKSRSVYKVVPHAAAIIFNERTIFKRLTVVQPKIPAHRFHLMDYNQLSARINTTTILTDVMGHITAIQRLEQKMIEKTRLESKCEVYIENISHQTIRITLWSDAAKNFDHAAIEQLPPPTFIVFTSVKVKEYQGKPVLSSTNSTLYFINPPIPELESYKIAFKDNAVAIKVLPPSAMVHLPYQQLKESQKVDIAELNILDPDLHKDKLIMCRATITRFNTNAGWWYRACPTCHKQVKPSPQSDELLCPRHGTLSTLPIPWFKVSFAIADATNTTSVIIIGDPAEQLFGISCFSLVVEQGFSDQNQFPDHILRLRGQTKNFQIRFGSMKNDFKRNDLLIHAVFDDEPQVLEQPSLPTDQQMVIHEAEETNQKNLLSTPSPTFKKFPPKTPSGSSRTSTKYPTLPSPKKAAVKRALFTSLMNVRKKFKSREAAIEEITGAETATNPIPTEDISSPDDIPLVAFKKKTAKSTASTAEKIPSTEANREDKSPTAKEGKTHDEHLPLQPTNPHQKASEDKSPSTI